MREKIREYEHELDNQRVDTSVSFDSFQHQIVSDLEHKISQLQSQNLILYDSQSDQTNIKLIEV
jgi:hypothetical protein